MNKPLVFVTKFGFAGNIAPAAMKTSDPELMFDETYLAGRLDLMQKLYFGSVADQTDDDFYVSILISASMPDSAKDQLRELAFDLIGEDRAEIHDDNIYRYRRACRQALSERFGTNEVLKVDLDSDDAVSVDFVELVKSEAAAFVERGYLQTDHRVIRFATGLGVVIGADDPQFFALSPGQFPVGQVIDGPASSADVVGLPEDDPTLRFDTVQIAPQRPFFLKAFHAGNEFSARPSDIVADAGLRDQWEHLLPVMADL